MQYSLFFILKISIIAILIAFVGCAEVKPWQKGNLVKSHMAFDPDPLSTRFMHHTYESKEAASGGYGISVVGCGCK